MQTIKTRESDHHHIVIVKQVLIKQGHRSAFYIWGMENVKRPWYNI